MSRVLFVAISPIFWAAVVMSACTPFTPISGGGDGLAPIIGPGGKQIYYINHEKPAVLKCLDPARKDSVTPANNGLCYGYDSFGPSAKGYTLPPCNTSPNTCNSGCTGALSSSGACKNIQTPIWTTPDHVGWDRWKFVGNNFITGYWSGNTGGLTCVSVAASWPANTYNPPVPCTTGVFSAGYPGGFSAGYYQTTTSSPTAYPILDYYELFDDGYIFYIDSKLDVGCLDAKTSLLPCTWTGTNPLAKTSTISQNLFQLDYVKKSNTVANLYIMFGASGGVYLDCVEITSNGGNSYSMGTCAPVTAPATWQMRLSTQSSNVGEIFVVKDSGNPTMVCGYSEDGPTTIRCGRLDRNALSAADTAKISRFTTWAGNTIGNQYSYGNRMYIASRNMGDGIFCYDWTLDDSCAVNVNGVNKCFGDISNNYVANLQSCGRRLPPSGSSTKDYAVVRDQYGCIYSFGHNNILWAVDENGSQDASKNPYCQYGGGLSDTDFCFGTPTLSAGCLKTSPPSFAGTPIAIGTIETLDVLKYSIVPPFGWNLANLVLDVSGLLGTAVIDNTTDPLNPVIVYTFPTGQGASNPFRTSFKYSICDNSFFPQVFTATVNIAAEFIIPPTNTPPSAQNDVFGVNQGNYISIPVLNNDSDPDAGDSITITNPSLLTTSLTYTAISGTNPLGSLQINPNNIWVDFNPDPAFCGNIGFDYQIKDIPGATAQAHVTGYVNCRPIAVDDSSKYDFASSPSATIDVLSNDQDLDGLLNANSLTVTAQPVCPGCTCNAALTAGMISFTSSCGGTFSFSYQVCDFGNPSFSIPPVCATATVSVTALYWKILLPINPATATVYWSMYLPQEICWEHNIGPHDVALKLIDKSLSFVVQLSSQNIPSAVNCYYYKPHNLHPGNPYYVVGTTINVSQNPQYNGYSWPKSLPVDLHPRPPTQ